MHLKRFENFDVDDLIQKHDTMMSRSRTDKPSKKLLKPQLWYKYEVEIFNEKTKEWESEIRYFWEKKDLQSDELKDIPNLRRNAKFLGTEWRDWSNWEKPGTYQSLTKTMTKMD